MEFYITLPSNVKHDTFENKVTNYKTKLATTVKLEDNWVVGLSSITYTKSWKEKKEIATVNVSYFFWSSKIIEDQININLESYDSIEKIVSHINQELEKQEKIYVEVDSDNREFKFKFPRLVINIDTNRLEIHFSTFKNAIVSLKMSDNLTRILGFDKNQLDDYIEKKHKSYKEEFAKVFKPEGKGWDWLDNVEQDPPLKEELIYKAEEPYNIKNDFHTLYVYCDLIKHNFVGDSTTQLLRLVEIPPTSKFRDQITINYTNVFYHKLLINEFNSIEIDIKNDLDQHIPFLFGRVNATLHFKKLIKNQISDIKK